MENIGAYAGGQVYQTNAGNHVAASNVDGRDTQIKDNGDGTYSVTVIKDGQVTYSRKLSEKELVQQFGADVSKLDIKLNGTNSKEEAHDKYGENVANKFYAVA